MIVACRATVKVPEAAEKISERRKIALPVDGVTSGVFDAVIDVAAIDVVGVTLGELLDVIVALAVSLIVGVVDGDTLGVGLPLGVGRAQKTALASAHTTVENIAPAVDADGFPAMHAVQPTAAVGTVRVAVSEASRVAR
jgi:hypothetical protein